MPIDASKVKWDEPAAGAPDPSKVQWDQPASAAPVKSGVVRRLVGDTAVDLASGVVAAGESAVGLADIPTFGGAGKALEAVGYQPGRAREAIGDLYSPERKLANQEVADAEGFVGTAGAMLRNPSTIAGAVVESLPSTLGGGAIARGLGGGARQLAPLVRGAIGEGAVQAGSAAEQSRQASDNGFLNARETVAAVGSGVGTGLISLAGGGVARRLGIGDVDTALAGGATAAAARPGFLRRTLTGAATEGVLEELPQSAQEQVWQNFAQERDLGEGVGEAAAAGLLTGATLGGGFAAVASPGSDGAADPGNPATSAPAAPAVAATPLPNPSDGPISRTAYASEVSGVGPQARAAQAAAEAQAAGANAAADDAATDAPGAPSYRLPPPPWIDPTSGELLEDPDLVTAKAYVHEQLNRLESAGEQPLNRGAWKRELGISSNLLANTVLGEVRAERAKGLTAPADQREDVLARVRAGEPVSERDRMSLGANETIGPRNAVRLFADITGLDQAQVNDAVAAIPAGSDGRRATLAVMQAAQGALSARTEVPDGSTAGMAAEGAAVEAGGDLLEGAAAQADAGRAAGEDAGEVAQDDYRVGGDGQLERRHVDRAGRPFWLSATAEEAERFQQGGAGEVVAPKAAGAAEAVAPVTSAAAETAQPLPQAKTSTASQEIDGAPQAAQASPVAEAQVVPNPATAQESPAAESPADQAAVEVGAVAATSPQDTPPAPDLHAAAHEAAPSPLNDRPEPTEAQKEAGNYKVGRARVAGLDVSIENPAGSRRRPEWPPLEDHYGYIRGSVGADKDHVDVFLTENAQDTTRPVFVVDQVNKDGSFDEHKVVMGAGNEAEARTAYLRNYEKGWTGLGAITQMDQDEFKAWVRDAKKTKRPAGKLAKAPARRKPAAAAPPAPIGDLGEKIGGARKDTSQPLGKRAGRAKPATTGQAWRRRYVALESTRDGKWQLHHAKKGAMGNRVAFREAFATREEAEAAIPLAEVSRNHRVVDRGESGFAIARSVTDRKRVVLKSGFESRDAAMRYLVENAEEIIDTKTSLGEEALPLPEQVLRQGPKRREGDVAGADFMGTFGFRGVEFGNWNNQAERQEVMNHAYDGLLDLADVLAVPPRALSLNGDLALAFGARGHGLTGARAHYERDYAVMNLTKLQGAGALAHEWMHAVDHYFGRQDGKASSERTTNDRGDTVLKTRGVEQDYLSHGHLSKSGVRAELLERYNQLLRTMVRRGEKYVEDTARAESFLGHARDQVSQQLTRIREHIATERRYGSRKRAATPEELSTFDAMSDRILNGDGLNTQWRSGVGRGTSSRWSNDTLEALNGVLKSVTNRGGFNATRGGDLDRLAASMTNYARRLAVWNDAQAGESKTRQVPTEFLTEAKKLDQGRGSNYWSTNHELLARAFSAYVEDKLQARGESSDFLSYGSSGNFALPVGEEWGRPFPRGEERTALNEAFDRFFGEIQTREDDAGRVALFSRRGWAEDFPDAVLGHRLGVTQAHPDYAAAKGGNTPAALRLANDLVTDDYVAAVRAALPEGSSPLVVPVQAVEVSGNNRIPAAAAQVLSRKLGLKVERGIVQATKVGRGGSDGLSRLGRQPRFDGKVEKGRDYLLLDDTMTQGGTFAQLKTHIEDNGGRVLLASALTGKDYSRKIALSPGSLAQVRDRFGSIEGWWRESFGFGFEGLTESEARFLLKLKGNPTPDAVRDRIAAGGLPESAPGDGRPLRSASGQAAVANAPPRAGRSASGLTATRARQLRAQLTATWGDNQPSIRLVQSVAELPADVQADPDAARIEGLYNGSPVVWLNLARIRTEQRFGEVLAHEVIGHYGVERVVGAKEWDGIVDAIAKLDRSGGGSAQLRSVFADVRRRQPEAAADPVTFAKEVIAFLAERGIRNSWVNRVVAAVRRFLRRMMPSLTWSEADVLGLLGQADSFLRRSSTPQERRALVKQYAFSNQGSPFYSALVSAVDTARGAPKQGDAKAWKGWLDGAQRRGEFRQAERDWLGVDAFLDSQGTVTRQQLADFVRANQVGVQDVVLGSAGGRGEIEAAFAARGYRVELDGMDAELGAAYFDQDNEEIEFDDLPASLQQVINENSTTGDRVAGETRFGQYTAPGGKNYRELLLTLPLSTSNGVEPRGEVVEDGADPEFPFAIMVDGVEANRSRTGGSVAQGILREEIDRALIRQGKKARFNSNHFFQPNILAHVRFNERTDADGKSVLFLEEIQSDWHQAGRKQGYRDIVDYAVYDKNDTDLPIGWGYRTEAEARAAHPGDQFEVVPTTTVSGVPNAPFKSTDEWAMLAFKRMVRWAADNGFDRIAWTTGEQQADRYSLAKSFAAIEAIRQDDGRFNLYLFRDADGGATGERMEVSAGDLEANVGKELADKIVSQKGKSVRYTGVDLKVGGEGMRAFYDKILPSAVNKWAKKFDARVGQVSLPVSGTFNLDLESAESTQDATIQHSLELTPTMRAAALSGQPLFSKAPADILDDVSAVMDATAHDGMLARARALLRDAVPTKAKDQLRTKWLALLTTRHLTQLGGDYFKNIHHFSNFLAEMGADRNMLQQEGEATAEKARKWASKNRGQARQLFDLMHDATIDGVDPAEEFKPLQFNYNNRLHDATRKNIKEAIAAIREQVRGRSGDNKTDLFEEAKQLRAMPARDKRRRQKYPALVERWNRLSPQAKEIYREFRDTYAERSQAMEQALTDRINDTDVPQKHKDRVIAVIRRQFETQRLQGVYFPLQRHGRFFVAAEKDETPAFLMFDRLTDLENAVRDLKRRGFKINARGLKSEGKAKDAPSGTFVAEIMESLNKAGVSDKTQDEIYQIYLQSLPEMSMRKHSIHRQSVPGFDPDAVRAFAWNMHHGAHQLARLRFGHKLQAVLELLKRQQKAASQEEGADTRRIAAGDAILGELDKRHEWIMNPQDSQATSLVSSFGFVWYLGLTPAAALVNLSQTALVSYPYLASRYGGVKAMNMLLSGMSASIRTGGHIQRTLTDPDEQRAHAYLLRSGALDKTQAHNLAGIAEGGLTGYNPGWARAMEIIGWGFHKAEVVNREATGLAAFRLAKAAGKGFDEAVQEAVDTIIDTHFDYTNANRARFMQSGTAKVLLMFRQYSLNMTWHLGRMTWEATKGETPEVRKLARRNLAGVLGMSALFSGTLGLPLMSVTMGVLNAIAASFGDDDEPWDAETEFRAFLADMLGPEAASVVLSGGANALTGADIASRVSLSQLWFRDADRQLDGRGAYYHLLEQAAGPMGGVLKNALVGKQLMDEGHLQRGIETVLPKALKDSLRAARYASEGVNTLRGDPLVPDASVRDTLLQLAGFTPAKVAERYDTNRALKNYEGFIIDRRSRLIDAYAMAQRLGDGEARQKVLAKIRAFNQANREVAITPDTIRRSLMQRARYSARAEGGITLDKRLAKRVRDAVGD